MNISAFEEHLKPYLEKKEEKKIIKKLQLEENVVDIISLCKSTLEKKGYIVIEKEAYNSLYNPVHITDKQNTQIKFRNNNSIKIQTAVSIDYDAMRMLKEEGNNTLNIYLKKMSYNLSDELLKHTTFQMEKKYDMNLINILATLDVIPLSPEDLKVNEEFYRKWNEL